MYLAYTYFIHNRITGQFYYGSRYKNIKLKRTPEQDFWKYYFTSSTLIKHLIKLYGKDSFDVELLFRNSDIEECFWKEQDYIKDKINNPLCLNRYYLDKESGKKTFSLVGLSKEELSDIKVKKQDTWSKKSKEKKEEHRNNIVLGHAAMSSEAIQESVQKVLSSKKGKWEEIGKLISRGHKDRTPEEQIIASGHYSEAQKKKYAALTSEEKEAKSKKISESVKLMHRNRSEDKKKKSIEKRRQTMENKNVRRRISKKINKTRFPDNA